MALSVAIILAEQLQYYERLEEYQRNCMRYANQRPYHHKYNGYRQNDARNRQPHPNFRNHVKSTETFEAQKPIENWADKMSLEAYFELLTQPPNLQGMCLQKSTELRKAPESFQPEPGRFLFPATDLLAAHPTVQTPRNVLDLGANIRPWQPPRAAAVGPQDHALRARLAEPQIPAGAIPWEAVDPRLMLPVFQDSDDEQ